jgi:hypothetical protein
MCFVIKFNIILLWYYNMDAKVRPTIWYLELYLQNNLGELLMHKSNIIFWVDWFVATHANIEENNEIYLWETLQDLSAYSLMIDHVMAYAHILGSCMKLSNKCK